MSLLKVYCNDESTSPEFTSEVMIDSSVSSRYAGSLVLEISDCHDISYVSDSVSQCKPVSITHGVYTTWVIGVISFASGKVDRLIVEATPFYRTGQTVTFDRQDLLKSRLEVPANGGNTEGVIRRIDYSFLGGNASQNLYIFFESCNDNDFLLDSRIGGNGHTNQFASSALEGSYQRHTPTFNTQSSVYVTGTYPISASLRQTLSNPRSVIYSSYSPTPPPPHLLNRLRSNTQGISTSFHTSGMPIAYTAYLAGATSLSHNLMLGSLVAPSTLFYSLDFIAFYPLTHFKALNVPFDFATSGVYYRRSFNKVFAHSGGGKFETSGDIGFSPYSVTSLYVVGTPTSLTVLPKAKFRMRVQTLAGFRMTCERLP